MNGYDAWLERPYQQRAAREPDEWVQIALDSEPFWLDGERVQVTSYEAWEDADEDGRHGGVDLIVKPVDGGREQILSQDRYERVIANQWEHRDDDVDDVATTRLPTPPASPDVDASPKSR